MDATKNDQGPQAHLHPGHMLVAMKSHTPVLMPITASMSVPPNKLPSDQESSATAVNLVLPSAERHGNPYGWVGGTTPAGYPHEAPAGQAVQAGIP